MAGTYRAALASVTHNRNLRLAQVSSASAWTGEFLFVTATTVYAFDQGGAAGAGLIGFLRVLPAAIALPFLGTLADRMSRRGLLAALCALRALSAAGAGVAAAGGQTVLAYALVTVSTVCHSGYRPVLAALLPFLCTTPDELASANAIRSILDGLAALAGPLVAAALLAEFDAGVSFGAVAVLAAVAALSAIGMRYETGSTALDDDRSQRVGVLAELADGFAELRRRPKAVDIFVLGSAQCLVRGALTVLAVVLAVDLTGLGKPGVGVLWAAFGVGGLVAALASIGAAGSIRLGTLFGLGIAMWGLPIVISGLLIHSAVAVAAFTVVGAANALVDVAAYTLLQRLVPEQMLARVLALLEAVFALAVALGSLLIPPLVTGIGNRAALVVTGAILPVATVLRYRALRAIDADIKVRTDRIALLRRVAMLRLLPVPAIEGLALGLRHVHAPGGTDVFREGDAGHDFYVVESGRVTVLEHGAEIRNLGPGDSFGEIALLRAVPRTATVRAVDDTELASLNGRRFVAAVTGFAATSSSAEALVDGYLAGDEQRHDQQRTDRKDG